MCGVDAVLGHLVKYSLRRVELVNASNFVAETIEFVLAAMTDYFVIDMEERTRTGKAYRMFVLGRNILAERERQHVAILEWVQQICVPMVRFMKRKKPGATAVWYRGAEIDSG